MSNSVVFYSLAGMAVLSAAGMITRRKAAHGAAFLAVTLLATAGIFLQLQSRLLFAMQIVLFAGAIAAMFFGVTKWLGAQGEAEKPEFTRQMGMLLVILGVLGGEGALIYWSSRKIAFARLLAFGSSTAAKMAPNARGVARSLFGSYQLAFAISLVLLVVAAVGAVTMMERKAEGGDALD